MSTKTITRNGKSITMPAGYASAEAYLATLRVNLKIALSRKSLAAKAPKIEADIAAVEDFLA